MNISTIRFSRKINEVTLSSTNSGKMAFPTTGYVGTKVGGFRATDGSQDSFDARDRESLRVISRIEDLTYDDGEFTRTGDHQITRKGQARKVISANTVDSIVLSTSGAIFQKLLRHNAAHKPWPPPRLSGQLRALVRLWFSNIRASLNHRVDDYLTAGNIEGTAINIHTCV